MGCEYGKDIFRIFNNLERHGQLPTKILLVPDKILQTLQILWEGECNRYYGGGGGGVCILIGNEIQYKILGGTCGLVL